MSKVEVNSESISKLINLCTASQSELEKTTANMQRQYQEFGSTWKDQKYKEFRDIVEKCCGALKQPLIDLERAKQHLYALLEIIQEYDNLDLNTDPNQSVEDISRDRLQEFSNNVIEFSDMIAENDRHMREERARHNIVGRINNRFNSAMWYNRNSNNPQIQVWRSRISEIRNRVRQFCCDNLSDYIDEHHLERLLRRPIRYETDESFASLGGDIISEAGFYDGHASRIYVERGGNLPNQNHRSDPLTTTVHEIFHQLSNNNGRNGIVINNANGVEQNMQINEAITELLMQRTLGDDYVCFSDYSNNRDAIADLANAMGIDIIYQAYFQNQPEILENEVDRTLGSGTWVTLSIAFDGSRNHATDEMSRTIRNDIIHRYVRAVNIRNGNISL